MNNKSRYVSLPNHPGIRKDKTSNTYQASKSISGKRLYANFKTLAEAIYWKNTFNPDVAISGLQVTSKNKFNVYIYT